MLVLAHLSDIHIGQDRKDGGARAEVRAEQVMAYLEPLDGLDAVLVTGDLADHGTPKEYATVARLLGSRHRVLTCPGNHDRREAYREHLLGEEPAGGPVDRVHRLPGGTVFTLDSSVPGRDHGLLADETLEWLDRELAATDPALPALVAFHHPPVPLHTPLVDRIRLRESDRLAEVLSRHPRVAAVLTGHSHTPAAATFAGRPLLVAPGVVSTVTLPFEGGPGIAFDHPPMLAFHLLDDDGGLTTHYRIVVRPVEGLAEGRTRRPSDG